jgi:hypothetical protein
LNESSREAGVPLVGHGPGNLGLDALLRGRESLAHVHMLSTLYWGPTSTILRLDLAASLVLIVLAVALAASVLIRRSKPAAPAASRVHLLVTCLLVAGLVPLFLHVDMFLWNNVDPMPMLLALSALAVVGALVTTLLVAATVKLWRATNVSLSARLYSSVAALGGVVLTCMLIFFWLPISWRATPGGIESMARKLEASRISVQTTLVAFAVLTSGPDRLRLIQADPAIDYLAPDVRDGWRRLPVDGAPVVPEKILGFMKEVTGALHRAGVLLLAGTDALGAPLVVPGTSLHDELTLLTDSGLTPYRPFARRPSTQRSFWARMRNSEPLRSASGPTCFSSTTTRFSTSQRFGSRWASSSEANGSHARRCNAC